MTWCSKIKPVVQGGFSRETELLLGSRSESWEGEGINFVKVRQITQIPSFPYSSWSLLLSWHSSAIFLCYLLQSRAESCLDSYTILCVSVSSPTQVIVFSHPGICSFLFLRSAWIRVGGLVVVCGTDVNAADLVTGKPNMVLAALSSGTQDGGSSNPNVTPSPLIGDGFGRRSGSRERVVPLSLFSSQRPYWCPHLGASLLQTYAQCSDTCYIMWLIEPHEPRRSICIILRLPMSQHTVHSFHCRPTSLFLCILLPYQTP